MSGLTLLEPSSQDGRPSIVEQLPMAVLVLFGLCLYWSGAAAGEPPRIDQVIKRAGDLSAGETILLAGVILTLTVILQPLQDRLIAVLQGDLPTPLGRVVSDFLIRHRHRLIRQRLELELRPRAMSEEYERASLALKKLRLYPIPERVLPTTFGNIIRAAQDQAGERYGLATITMWPQKYTILPDRAARIFEQRKQQMDLIARFTVAFALASLLSFWLLIGQGHGYWYL